MVIIVGLGNVGFQYRNTFHNMGFKVVDYLSAKMGIEINKEKYKALIGQGSYLGQSVMLVKPTTFMNHSGECLALLKQKNKEARIIVAVDDIDLPKGKVRYRERGSSGTHNGLRSIVEYIGEDFERVRVGVGRDPSVNLADYVLSNIKPEDKELFEKAVIEAGELIISKIIG